MSTGQTRARVGVSDQRRFDQSQPSQAEREHLANGLGAVLRAGRVAAGMSARALAEEAGASIATVSNLEAGKVRPRPRMLADLASVLDPDGTARLGVVLLDLAGPSLREDTAAGVRRRRRRVAAVQRRRRDAAREANGRMQESRAVIANLARVSTPNTLGGAQQYLATFDAALTRSDALRHEARRIGAQLRRRPIRTPDAVVAVTAAFLRADRRAMSS